MSKYCLGIDTGGTFTDAVLIDTHNKKPISWEKTPTTHYDLGVCINDIIVKILGKSNISSEEIKTISISTTLATNAVVEGKGAKVALFMIGLTTFMDLPVVDTIYIQGGHKWTGEEENPLNLEGLSLAIEEIKDKVDGYAVVSNMSFVNPTHELVTAEAIRLLDPKPVVLSHQLTTRAGMKERAATSVFNARLTPIMTNFIKKILSKLDELDIHADVFIIRGDGGTMTVDDAMIRPVDTISSGPAASTIYGCYYITNSTPYKDAIIVDIGGTTTDISVILDNKPIINEYGSIVSKWQTHTKSIDTFTIGLGGDSLIRIYNNIITIGPGRVQPLSTVKWEGFSDFLRNNGLYNCIIVNDLNYLYDYYDNSEADTKKIYEYIIKNKYFTKEIIYNDIKVDKYLIDKVLNDLLLKQIISTSSFTPTDALSFLNRIDFGNRANAEVGLFNLSKTSGMSPEKICNEILSNIREKISSGIIEYLIKIKNKDFPSNALSDIRNNNYFQVKFKVNLPIVGLGAASPYLLSGIDEIFETALIFPPFYEIGNAYGAAVSAIGMLKL